MRLGTPSDAGAHIQTTHRHRDRGREGMSNNVKMIVVAVVGFVAGLVVMGLMRPSEKAPEEKKAPVVATPAGPSSPIVNQLPEKAQGEFKTCMGQATSRCEVDAVSRHATETLDEKACAMLPEAIRGQCVSQA